MKSHFACNGFWDPDLVLLGYKNIFTEVSGTLKIGERQVPSHSALPPQTTLLLPIDTRTVELTFAKCQKDRLKRGTSHD